MHWNILLLACGALQAILLAALLLNGKSYRAGYGFLSLYLAVLTAQLLFKIADKVWLMNNVTLGYSLSYQLPLLYGPLAYLFARRLMQSRKWIWKDALHFVPFAYAFVVETFVDYSSPYIWFYLPIQGWYGTLLQLISVVCYHVKALDIWKKYNVNLRNRFSDIHVIRMLWVRRFLVTSMVVCGSIALVLYFIYFTHPTFSYLRWTFVALTAFIYWISYCAIKQPQLFVPIVNRTIDTTLAAPMIPPLVVKKSPVKYASSNLSVEEGSRIQAMLLNLMEEEKLYTDAELTIDRLAARCNSNRHILSQVLNQRLQQSFYDFVNSYRINEARKLLSDPRQAHIKIASIAYDAGFNSLSAFNDVFKKMTGSTPSVFRKGGDSGEKGRLVSGEQ